MSVFADCDQLLDAELELAKTKEQRYALYRKKIDNMCELEELITRRYKAGRSPLEANVLGHSRATASRD